MSVTFYMGTHMPSWLRLPRLRDVPLFPTRNRLNAYKTLPRAVGRYAIDSNGFTELQRNGQWTVTPVQFAAQIRRIVAGVGTPDFVSPMDWMCEPWVITGRNWHLPRKDPKYFHGTREARGLGPVIQPGDDEQPFDEAVCFHQERTVENLIELRRLAPEIPWMPVLQGWELRHYLDCVGMYAAAGVDLSAEPIVGLGSVCRRQALGQIEAIVFALASKGLRLHGFGVKTSGLAAYAPGLVSADSLAWSYGGRKVPGCGPSHKTEANCLHWAMAWRNRVLASAEGSQPWLFGGAA